MILSTILIWSEYPWLKFRKKHALSVAENPPSVGKIVIDCLHLKESYFNLLSGNFPSEISILAYDAIGLIYYTWKKNGSIDSINDFYFKEKIKGKIGTFSFNNKKTIQDLSIYKAANNRFTKF